MNGTDLIQILLNLTVNAFQCTSHPHTVEIACRVQNEPLDLARFQDGPENRALHLESFANIAPIVAFSVKDDGPGIEPEVLPSIFQPYFSTKGPGHGTGLGLNIVLRLIRENHGALHVRTEPGRGTVFTVFFACAPWVDKEPAR
jgi:signal transduction histidine kinase